MNPTLTAPIVRALLSDFIYEQSFLIDLASFSFNYFIFETFSEVMNSLNSFQIISRCGDNFYMFLPNMYTLWYKRTQYIGLLFGNTFICSIKIDQLFYVLSFQWVLHVSELGQMAVQKKKTMKTLLKWTTISKYLKMCIIWKGSKIGKMLDDLYGVQRETYLRYETFFVWKALCSNQKVIYVLTDPRNTLYRQNNSGCSIRTLL